MIRRVAWVRRLATPPVPRVMLASVGVVVCHGSAITIQPVPS
jgi:hypothetical protein